MRKILVIEDDDFLRESLVDFLGVHNFDVVATDDSFNGLRIAHEVRPDLILCEGNIPMFTSAEVIKALRHNLITSHIPILLLIDDSIMGCFYLRIGANDYLEKSSIPTDLLPQIYAQLEQQELFCV
jgi:DNA-binding response OmpR family regulator